MSTPSYLNMEAEWRLRAAPPGAEAALAPAAAFGPLLRRLLAVRGFGDPQSAEAYLAASLRQCHDPLLLSGMDAAVRRLAEAWRAGEKVAVLGDYDVDGVTSTVLLLKLFTLLGLPHEAYIPDRVREGYGPNPAALRALKEGGARVVVTVDCGITALPEALEARALGLDLIITDHHLPGAGLPLALAVVNPQCSPDYPYAMLGGVGVAYKLAQALLQHLDHPRRAEFLDHMLELVALGTICDVAPLDGENRALVREGLQRLRQGRWLGLRSLAQASGLDLKEADAKAVGFQLGPRLNAGGRIGDAMLGVRLLMGKDPAESRALAASLDAENRRRRGLEQEALDQAMVRAEERLAAGARGLVLWDAAWHPGVVGLVASRLLERFNAPAFVFSVDGDRAKGSGRSRRPFNLVQALGACSAHLLKFGGHAVAAGASAERAALPAFAEAFEAQAAALGDAERRRVIDVDLEIRLRDIEDSWMDQLQAMEPFGMRNPRPLFLARGLRLGAASRAVGDGGAHLKLDLSQGGAAMAGIAFRQGPRLEALRAAQAVDAVFHLGWNVWQGSKSIQLDVLALRPGTPAGT